jgi:hypothetical protein
MNDKQFKINNMKQIILNYDTEYATESMSDIPAGYIDKSICACGLTSVALENDKNVVLAVPTIYLSINKADQYPNARSNNTVLPVWGDTSSTEITHYILGNPITKIICTYDSLHKVKHLLPDSHLIIDESNMLLSTTKQRPDAIANLFEIAYEYKDTVSFISATPIPLMYMPEWVSTIDQVKINWSNTIKVVPILCERTYPFKTLCDEFLIPLNSNGSMTVAGKTFDKVIVFVNTVLQISKIIRESGLNRDECGIICGDTLKNDVKIAGLKRYRNGNLPKFLFLTSSGFCGIDLVDDTAMTIIVSNTGKDWQMIDMLTDLKQAISRQRNKNNPNYGSYIYIYNQVIFSKSEEDLLRVIEDVRRKIEVNIPHYNYLKSIGEERNFMYDSDFEAYSLFKDGKYLINEQAFNADKYFILETRNQYLKGFDVRDRVGDCRKIEPVILPRQVNYSDLVDYFLKNNKDGEIAWGVYSTREEWIKVIEDSYRFFKKVWKDYTYAKEMIKNYGDTYEQIKLDIKCSFSIGSRYTRAAIREILKEIYIKYGINRLPRHYDLQKALLTKEVKVMGERMVEIIGKKNRD